MTIVAAYEANHYAGGRGFAGYTARAVHALVPCAAERIGFRQRERERERERERKRNGARWRTYLVASF
jgi:hypothetical protein